MKQFSLEDKMQELKSIEHYFQNIDINLEEGIAKHEEALKIGREILEYLEKIETKLEEIDPRSSFEEAQV